MASAMTDPHGLQAEPIRPLKLTRWQVRQNQDIAIVRLRQRRVCWETIGQFFRMTDRAAKKRWDCIPPEARERYRRMSAFGGIA